MANLRSPHRLRHGRSVAPLETPPSRPRWSVLAGIAAPVLLAAVLALAWADGGEGPVRPMAQPVQLPEQVR